MSLIGLCGRIDELQVVDKLSPVEFSIELVHLWDFQLQVGKISLREAAHHKKVLDAVLSLSLHIFEYRVD